MTCRNDIVMVPRRHGMTSFVPSDETSRQHDRRLEIERMTQVYAARRAAGLADNDAGMGRLAEPETRNWRPS